MIRGFRTLGRAMAIDAAALAECRSAVAAIKGELEMALESVSYIGASAEQAYLEHDPAERMPKVEYERRYQTFARGALEAGLAKYESATVRFGKDGVESVAPPRFMLLVADSMLARDQIVKKLTTKHEISCTTYQ
mmetsp:Transcript_25350/g.70923  ORF Transcript_25350/g.70923 Transcript_25350/m.70923 type:complete len:135 (-) Transcript_25350:397-801(-)